MICRHGNFGLLEIAVVGIVFWALAGVLIAAFVLALLVDALSLLAMLARAAAHRLGLARRPAPWAEWWTAGRR